MTGRRLCLGKEGCHASGGRWFLRKQERLSLMEKMARNCLQWEAEIYFPYSWMLVSGGSPSWRPWNWEIFVLKPYLKKKKQTDNVSHTVFSHFFHSQNVKIFSTKLLKLLTKAFYEPYETICNIQYLQHNK